MSYESARCGSSRSYSQKGTVNGAEWFSISGSGSQLYLVSARGRRGTRNSNFVWSYWQACRTSTTFTPTVLRWLWSWAVTSSPLKKSCSWAGMKTKRLCWRLWRRWVSLHARVWLRNFCSNFSRALPQAHRGIKGIVKDEAGIGIKGAQISVRGVRHNITSGKTSQSSRRREQRQSVLWF